MSNSPSPTNVQRALRVQRELDAKVTKRFRQDESMTVKDAYVLALQYATRDVQLTAAERHQVARDVERAKNCKAAGGREKTKMARRTGPQSQNDFGI